MPLWKQALLRRYHEAADDGTGAGSGTGSGSGDDGKTGDDGTGTGSGDDGKGTPPKVSDAEAKLIKENMKKKEELTKLSGELNAAKALIAQLEELGGLDTIKSLVNEKKDNETKQLEAKGEWERLKVRMAEEHAKELKAAKEQAAAIQSKFDQAISQINELTIGAAFSNSKTITEDLVLTPAKTRVVYGDHFDLVDGKVVGFDKPRGAANRTPLVDASGNPVSFDEALAKIVDADPEKDSIRRSKVKPGAGSDSKKVTDAAAASKQSTEEATGISKIAAGIKGLKVV